MVTCAARDSPVSAAWQALGTRVSVFVEDPRALEDVRAFVEDSLAELDLACSRFRPDSELASVNGAGGKRVSVSPLFLEALQAALRAARLTDGDVDPTIGRALRLIGYDRDLEQVRGRPRPPIAVTAVPGWRSLEVDPGRGTVRVPTGVELDLGATAKALAADRTARSAAELARCGVLVDLGGDLAVAGEPPAGGWAVRVTDDHAADFEAPGQTVSLTSGGLATSSITVRRWSQGGHDLHHILDPSTGRPAPAVWRTTSVAAASCLDANTASTAAIIRGGRALGWLESLGLPARLVGVGGDVVRVAGWPEP